MRNGVTIHWREKILGENWSLANIVRVYIHVRNINYYFSVQYDVSLLQENERTNQPLTFVASPGYNNCAFTCNK